MRAVFDGIGDWRAILIFAAILASGCGATGGGSTSPPPPPPPPSPQPITVSVTPVSVALMLGVTQQFNATVTNTTNVNVTWMVNGVAGGNGATGTITSAGLYTAPQILPAPGPIVIQAVSQADTSKSATASLTVSSDIGVSVSPAPASVELGAARQFAATITSSGNPDRNVTWSVAGTGCAGAACGAVDATGLYTAPQILPAPASVTLTARSVADTTKAGVAAVTITSNFTLSVSGPSAVQTGASAQYSATLTPAANSNPSTVVAWSVSGAGCSGAACGTISSNGNYTAPSAVPSPPTVNVIVTPQADPSRAASLNVTIQAVSTIGVQILPVSSTLAVLHRQTFSATVTGTANQNVSWTVNGVAGGDSTFGQICAVASNPCQAAAPGAAMVDYVAPASLPAPNPLLVSASSQADSTKQASATVTILAHVQVSVSPPSVTLAPLSKQMFSASVAGTTDQSVTWQVSGAACGGVGLPCGVIDPTGLYSAPLAPPSPNTVNIVAISGDDPSRSGTAAVTLGTGPAILTLLPSSAVAGTAGGFTLVVSGANFVSSSPGPGSVVLIGGTARTTNCPDVNTCTTILGGTDVATAGTQAVQVRNPNNATSNQVAFVVAGVAGSEEVIPLTPTAPSAGGKDIVVVDKSTAGISNIQNSVDLNVAGLGAFSIAANSCVLAGNPLMVVRPVSGTTTADLCAFSSSGLDASMTYTFSGPTPNDIVVIAKQPVGFGIIRLTLQLSSTTLTGPRTLFIENANKDKTAASGAIEVK